MNGQKSVYQTIAELDRAAAGYGYDGGYGLTLAPGMVLPAATSGPVATMDPRARMQGILQRAGADMAGPMAPPVYANPGASAYPAAPQATSYSVNPAIQKKTYGASTFQIQISVARTGTGSGNTYDPVFLFGGDAFTNASAGYTAVQRANQTTALAVANGKNVITFRYGDVTNNTTYTVTLLTAGEYPFVLNSLSGARKMVIDGIQLEISDVAQTAQLRLPIQEFYLNEFGKAESNDLSTPRDLYQQQDDGIFIPHKFTVSGQRGITTNVLNVNGFSVTYFCFGTPVSGGCGC